MAAAERRSINAANHVEEKASTNNGSGIAGTAWNVTIIPVKVLGSDGNGTYSNIAKGITYAADQGAKVINCSLSGTTSSSTLQSAVNYAWNKGAIVVCSAGNTNSTVGYPGACNNAIAVAAVDNSDVKSSYSSFGPEVFVTAPGNSVYSTLYTGGYGSGSGTSFSAPFVSGLAALIYSINPGATPAQIKDIIKQGAKDLGDPGFDAYYGWGRIDLYRSLAIASGLNPDASAPTAAPAPAPDPTAAPVPDTTVTPPPAPISSTFTGNVAAGQTVTAVSKITMTGSQDVELVLKWDVKKTNLDLYLYNSYGSLVAKSAASTASCLQEYTRQVLPAGDYTVKVVSVTGKANYTLTINNK